MKFMQQTNSPARKRLTAMWRATAGVVAGAALLSLSSGQAQAQNRAARQAAQAAAQAATEAAQRPNIIFILADDLGWRDTAPYGSTFHETPHLSRLAARGMVFQQAYAAAPICSPTRAAILTGQHPARLQLTVPVAHVPEVVFDVKLPESGPRTSKAIPAQSRTRLAQDYTTLAERLRDNGYATAHFGKWHLGAKPYSALEQGFETVISTSPAPSPSSYFSPYNMAQFGLQDGPKGEHLDDRNTQEAIKFIEKNRDKPFYLNYWTWSVHGPWDGKAVLAAKYDRKANPQSPQRNPLYAAMVETLDAQVGKLLDTLDRLKIADNTIVVFTSDNGGINWDNVEGRPITSNLPLRGGKSTLYEGGTREPLLIAWPRVVKPNTRTDALVTSVDFVPTFLEAANLPRNIAQKQDGFSFLPVLKGETAPPRAPIFCHFPHNSPASGGIPGTYVRRGDFKLIRFYADNPDRSDRLELYNLRDDIGETRDLSAQNPALARELNGLISDFLRETGAQVPLPNPNYDPSLPPRTPRDRVRRARRVDENGNVVAPPAAPNAKTLASVVDARSD